MLKWPVDECGDVGSLFGNRRLGDEIHEVTVADS